MIVLPHIISLGAGVQSSAMALMAAHGEITPIPAFAIFADTGDEPGAVYRWLEKLKAMLPFPVHTVMWSKLSDHLFEWGHSQIPAFVRGADGKPAMGKRQCTKHWKIVPIQRGIRSITNTQRKHLPDGNFVLWQGISLDEIDRMADSREKWIKHRWPLIELRISRRGCLEWMSKHGYDEPPKSACLFCSLKKRVQWQALKKAGGAEWDLVIDVSRRLAERGEYLTQDLKPIEEIDFSRPLDQHPEFSFRDECEGMCGV